MADPPPAAAETGGGDMAAREAALSEREKFIEELQDLVKSLREQVVRLEKEKKDLHAYQPPLVRAPSKRDNVPEDLGKVAELEKRLADETEGLKRKLAVVEKLLEEKHLLLFKTKQELEAGKKELEAGRRRAEELQGLLTAAEAAAGEGGGGADLDAALSNLEAERGKREAAEALLVKARADAEAGKEGEVALERALAELAAEREKRQAIHAMFVEGETKNGQLGAASAELSTQLERAKEENKRIQAALAAAAESGEAARAERDALGAKQTKEHAHAAKLVKEVEALKAQLESIRKEQEEATAKAAADAWRQGNLAKVAAMQKAKAAEKTRGAAFEAEIAGLKKQVGELERTSAAAVKKAELDRSALAAERAATRKQAAENNRRIEEMEEERAAEHAALAKVVGEQHREMRKALATAKDAQKWKQITSESMEMLDVEVAALREAVEAAREEIQATRAKAAEELSAAAKQAVASEEALRALRAALDGAERRAAEAPPRAGPSASEVAEVAELAARAERANIRADALQVALAEAEEAKKNLGNRVRAMRKERDEFERLSKARDGELNYALDIITQRDDAIRVSKEEVARATTRRRAAERQAAQVKSRADDALKAAERLREESEIQIEEASKWRSAMEDWRTEAEELSKELKKKNVAAKKDAWRAQESAAAAEARAVAAAGGAAEATEEVNVLRGMVSNLQAELRRREKRESAVRRKLESKLQELQGGSAPGDAVTAVGGYANGNGYGEYPSYSRSQPPYVGKFSRQRFHCDFGRFLL